MPDNPLDPVEPPAGDPPAGDPPAGDPPAGDPPAGDPPAEPAERPESVPEKFWDAEKGEVDMDKFSKSYTEMEKKFSQRKPEPGAPDEYELKMPEGLELDDTVMKMLKDTGQSNENAQQVVDTFYEMARPIVADLKNELLATQVRADQGIDMGEGGDETYKKYVQGVFDYATNKYGKEEAIRRVSTLEGVREIDTLMGGGADRRLPQGAGAAGGGSDASSDVAKYHAMLSDPKMSTSVEFQGKALALKRDLVARGVLKK